MFVRGEYCGSWWHAETRMAKEQYEVSQHVESMMPPGDYKPEEGEWVADPGHVIALATESDELIDAIGEVPEHRKFECSEDIEFGCSAVFARDLLIKLLKAMDGDYVRVELQQDGLMRTATSNWKGQATMGLVSPIREESRNRLVENDLVDFDVKFKNSLNSGGQDE